MLIDWETVRRKSLLGIEQLCGDTSRASAVFTRVHVSVSMANSVPCGYVPLDLEVA